MNLMPEGWRVGVLQEIFNICECVCVCVCGVCVCSHMYSEGRRETGDGGKRSLKD